MVYLDKFIIPDAEQEEVIIQRRMAENGGVYGYIDNRIAGFNQCCVEIMS